MKKWFFILSIAASVAVLLAQTRTPINIGTVADDKSGDPARNAFIKINNNESNIFRLLLTNSMFVARTSALSSLSSLSGSAYPIVFVQGTFGGLFRWHSASSQSTNAYTVIAAPYGAATGRYIRESDANAAPIVVNELQTLADGDAFGDYRLAYVTSDTIGAEGSIGLYYYDPYSTASDDGVEVVLPSGAIAEGRGRWIRLALDNMVGSTANTTPSKLVGLDANRKAKTLDVGVTDIASKVDSIAALVALDPTDRKLVQTLGYYAPGDGGGAVYRWAAGYSGTTNAFGGALAVTGGAWVQVTGNGEFTLKQFGAKGDASIGWIRAVGGAPTPTDDAAAFQAAVNWCSANGIRLRVPKGNYYIGSAVTNQSMVGLILEGETPTLALTGQYTAGQDVPQTSFVRDGNYTLLTFAGALTADQMTNGVYLAGGQHYAQVKDLLFQDRLSNSSASAPFMVMKRSYYSRWDNVQWSGIYSTCLDMYTADDAIFNNCRWISSGAGGYPNTIIHRTVTVGSEPQYTANNTLSFIGCNWESAYSKAIEVPTTDTSGDVSTLVFTASTVKNADFITPVPLLDLFRAFNVRFDLFEVTHDPTGVLTNSTLEAIVKLDRCFALGTLSVFQLGTNSLVTLTNAVRIVDPRNSDITINVGSWSTATIAGAELVSVSASSGYEKLWLSGKSFVNDVISTAGAFGNKPFSNWHLGGDEVVPGITELMRVAPRPGMTVRTAHHTTAGDGGGGVYRWSSTVGTTNAYGGRLSSPYGGAWVLETRPYLFNHFGVLQDGLASSGEANRARIQSALQFLATGGEIELPPSANVTFVGPEAVRPNVNITNLTITFNGNITVPATNDWAAGHPLSLFHFSDAGTYNNVTIQGRGIIDGNATNQPTASADNYGKMMGIRFDDATNVVVKDITIQNFGYFALLGGNVNQFKLIGTTIIQTNGNNDSRAPGSWGRNGDGAHFDNSGNVTVIGNDIQSTDDCVAFTVSTSSFGMTNIVIANNRLRPYAPNATYVPSGIRVAEEPGVTNSVIDNVVIDGNVIEPEGANGMYIGVMESSARSQRGIVITDNVIRKAAYRTTVPIGPDVGDTITFNAISSGGMYLLHCHDALVSGNTFLDNGGHGISVANCGTVNIIGNTFKGIENPAAAAPAGSAIYLVHGSYDENDAVVVEGNVFEDIDGSAVYGSGSTYQTDFFRFANNTVNDWHSYQAASAARTYSAVFLNRSVTNIITGNRFGIGFASGVIAVPFSDDYVLEVRGNTFDSIQANPAIEGASEWIRSARASTPAAVGGKVIVENNSFGYWRSRVMNLDNHEYLAINNNTFFAEALESGVDTRAVNINFSTNTTGTPHIIISDNKAHYPSKVGSNPTTLFRVLNNNGSGGSAVTLTTHVSGNYTSWGSTMVPWVDGFQNHNIDLSYSGTTVNVYPYGREPYQYRLTVTNNFTLAFNDFYHGMSGTIYFWPAATNTTGTLSSRTFSPTGGTFTVNGGTGNTNFTVGAFDVIAVGGTNRIAWNASNYYR